MLVKIRVIISEMSTPEERLVDQNSKPEDRLENAIRPSKLSVLIGQERVKENPNVANTQWRPGSGGGAFGWLTLVLLALIGGRTRSG